MSTGTCPGGVFTGTVSQDISSLRTTISGMANLYPGGMYRDRGVVLLHLPTNTYLILFVLCAKVCGIFMVYVSLYTCISTYRRDVFIGIYLGDTPYFVLEPQASNTYTQQKEKNPVMSLITEASHIQPLLCTDTIV